MLEIEERRDRTSKRYNDAIGEIEYKNQNAKVQRLLRRDKDKYINEQCEVIENNAVTNATKELYQTVRNITKKFKPSSDTVKDEDGRVLCDGERVRDRWKEYCTKLYTKLESPDATQVEWRDNGSEPSPLLSEVKKAIKELKYGKGPGTDEVTAEMIKRGGEGVETSFHKLCTKVWNEKEWPDDWVKSVFIPIPKKGDTLRCNNNRTIALISHSSKILLKIIAGRMKNKLKEEIADEQMGFRPGLGTRNQILNLKMVIEKNRERGKDLFLCFIDYTKAFDMVGHDVLWRNMIEMGFPTHIVLMLKSLYDQQRAAVRTAYGLTDWFKIEQGVRQGCILSPHLFNIYSETIMRNALDNFEGDVTIGGHRVTNADDVVLIAGTMEELQKLVNRVKKESEKVGLLLNVKKTKVMKVQRHTEENDSSILVNNEAVENVDKFTYLGAVFTNTYDDSTEIRRRIAIAKKATIALTNIWKDRGITQRTKLRLLSTLVFPIASYGAECWVMKNADNKRIQSFELWTYRRVLRISWTKKITNEEVLRRINPKERLLNTINRRKLQFVGHVLRSNNLDQKLLMGAVYGKRGRGRPKARFSDSVGGLCGLSMTNAARLAQDRDAWRTMVRRVTAAQT